MADLAITLRTLPVGTHVIGPLAVEAGLTTVSLNLEVGVSMSLGQVVWIQLEVSPDGGNQWTRLAKSDFTGPGLDRLGIPRTNISLRSNFGGTGIERRVAGERWLVRGLLTITGASVAITDGALTAI